MQKKLIWKLLTILFLCLLSLIPLSMVKGVIGERQALRNGVIRGLEQETVGPQVLKGPVLVVPYRKRVITIDREKRDGSVLELNREHTVSGSLYFLPESVEIEGSATPSERRRGIYKALAYTGEWTVKGRFDIPARFGVGANAERYTWGKPELGFGIADPRGLAAGMSLEWDGSAAVLDAGTDAPGLGRGVHANVTLDAPAEAKTRSVEFVLRMKLSGLNHVRFLPTGRNSAVMLESTWPHPSFFGPLLAEHTIDADGIRAAWRSSYLANNLHREYAECSDKKQCGAFEELAFGVSLIEPVDLYRQLERSAKYGLLFVGLTFMAFFLFDVLKSRPVHPVQYGLVGGALVVFYLLVTSLSEHTAFALAYSVAAIACVSLIGYYVAHVLGSWQRGSAIGAMLAALYAVLYVILHSEDNALLMGSVLLFALLAAIMVGTRKVDWYGLGESLHNARSGKP
jgi:inner membrane protein